AELAAGRLAVELPVDLGASTIHSAIPGPDFAAQGLEVRDLRRWMFKLSITRWMVSASGY
ncbi:MAG: hypothetical protein ABFD60_08920, partial [Bryobacteraceae bacterium]